MKRARERDLRLTLVVGVLVPLSLLGVGKFDDLKVSNSNFGFQALRDVVVLLAVLVGVEGALFLALI